MKIINTPSSPQERKMAILAHASILLTFIVGVTSGGLGTLVTVFAPLLIWVTYKDRSPYVAFHALQATIFQVGMVLLTLVSGTLIGGIIGIAWFITGVLSIILVGLLLLPIALIITLIGVAAIALIPLGGLTYGLIGAWQTYNDEPFRYYLIADWLDRRLEEKQTFTPSSELDSI